MNVETMITELNAVVEKHKNDFVPTFQTNITAMCRDIIPKLEQLKQYEAIGTVEEFREAMERQRTKKPILSEPCEDRMLEYHCPVCGEFVCHALSIVHTGANKINYCTVCGNKLDWSW